jgi:hypothetical protein
MPDARYWMLDGFHIQYLASRIQHPAPIKQQTALHAGRGEPFGDGSKDGEKRSWIGAF